MRTSTQYLLTSVTMLLLTPVLCLAEQYPVYPTEMEYRVLPSYCKEKIQKKNYDENQMWAARFGADTWMHMHHYCQGLNDINRYYRARNSQDKKYILSTAVNQFDYMVGHIPTDSVLLSEVLSNRGRVLLLAGQLQKGIRDLYKAIELDPGSQQPYLALAEEFQKSRNKNKALQIVSEGLRNIPESKSLKRRYKEFGGKEPYPEAISEPSPVQSALTPEATIETKPETKTETTNADTTRRGKEVEQKSTTYSTDDTSKIGTPNNPYCRFCPD